MAKIKKFLGSKCNKVMMLGIVGVVIFNLVITQITGFNIIHETFKTSLNLLNSVINSFTTTKYTKEVKSVTIESDGYASKEEGSYHIEKSADWTGLGKARVHFDVDTVMKTSDNPKDVIFILDVSSSMAGDKLDRVKQDSKELIRSLLSNGKNQAALITFESNAKIVSKFTNDQDSIMKLIDGLSSVGCTNYNQALILVDEILKDYQKQDGRDVVVLFLTDGYPNEETNNEIVEYETLKNKYPYLTVNAIQYEMGIEIVPELVHISDEQFYADMETLNNVLFDASLNPEFYESFEIVDWIANDYFEVVSEEDIKVSLGSVKLETVDGKQKVTWTVPKDTLRTGSSMTMDIDLKLKEQYVGSEGYYPTNEKEEVTSKLPDEEEKKQESEDVPVLKSGYKVYYDANYPSSCKTQKYSKEETHYAFENVKISDEEPPACEGYIFKGWGLASDVQKINDDYFRMPTNDVYLKGQWTSLSLSKSMDGKIHEKLTLYKVVQNDGQPYVGELPSGNTGTIYYYRFNTNNNVIFADTCWQIVRTTETGGIKLLYNGLPTEKNGKKVCDNSGTSQRLPSTSPFNSGANSPAYVGYMYNKVYEYKSGAPASDAITGNSVTYSNGQYTLVNTSNTIDDTHHYTCNSSSSSNCTTVRYYYMRDHYYIELTGGKTVEDALNEMLFADDVNQIDSDIKKVVDQWYEENILGKHDSVLEDTVFCNDRTLADINGWSPNGNIHDDLNFQTLKGRDLTCKNQTDKFTVSSSIGNGKLKYPVGLLTAAEADMLVLANIGEYYWLMSPQNFCEYGTFMGNVDNQGSTGNHQRTNVSDAVRPVVSLKPGVEYSQGDGTSDNPYVINETR